MGTTPSGLLCWLTVIWSGAPTDSLGEAHSTKLTTMRCILERQTSFCKALNELKVFNGNNKEIIFMNSKRA
jgi:hypothetical protein